MDPGNFGEVARRCRQPNDVHGARAADMNIQINGVPRLDVLLVRWPGGLRPSVYFLPEAGRTPRALPPRSLSLSPTTTAIRKEWAGAPPGRFKNKKSPPASRCRLHARCRVEMELGR